MITLGLILFFINLLMLYITSWIVSGFEIDSFMSGVWATDHHRGGQLGADQHLRRRRAAPALRSAEAATAGVVRRERARPAVESHPRSVRRAGQRGQLQQTQYASVLTRWQAWLVRWPTVESLAAAARADVIRAWDGLGYNRRAVNLHRAAQSIADHGWPDDLTELPGVGRYTADAVASRCFGAKVLPVDVNVRRVLERSGPSSTTSVGQR